MGSEFVRWSEGAVILTVLALLFLPVVLPLSEGTVVPGNTVKEVVRVYSAQWEILADRKKWWCNGLRLNKYKPTVKWLEWDLINLIDIFFSVAVLVAYLGEKKKKKIAFKNVPVQDFSFLKVLFMYFFTHNGIKFSGFDIFLSDLLRLLERLQKIST